MITQLFMVPVTGAARVSSDRKKTDTSFSSNKPSQFESILGARLSRNENRKANLKSSVKETCYEDEERISSVSNRQAGARSGVMNTKRATDSSKAEQKDENYEDLNVSDEEMNAKRETSSNLLNIAGILAPIMNMDSEELVLLFDSAGIELSDLAGGADVQEMVSKLSELLGLNENQERILTELLSMAEGLQAGQTLNGGMEQEAGYISGNNNFVRVEHDDFTVINQKDSVDLTEVIAKFKAQLEPKSMINDAAEASVPEDVEPMLLDEKDNLDEANIYEAAEQVVVPADTEQSSEIENFNEKSGMDGNPGKKPTVDVSKSDINTEEDFSNEYNSLIASMTSGNAEKTGFDAGPVQVSESFGAKNDGILSQVMEKAKVVLTENKSEMVVDLKPDHLGKLSLKLITENGIVMAKFTAESQQVKEVLEANMQLLKSALEKQGFVVQGFDVSVGRDSNNESEKRNLTGDRLKTYGIRTKATTGMTVGVAAVMDIPDAVNPYMISGSSIDLTA